ncbi:hypothetical protein PG994_000735 [Apiospora phragmitis]|uniref:Ribosomal protein S21 n=1 Tax=Apiospora phragmitis TaxID=2905665 RepID=A0ABR1X708_9PEZI
MRSTSFAGCHYGVLRALSINGCPARTTRHYADWTAPSRSRPSRPDEGEILKPTGPSSTSSPAANPDERTRISMFRNRNAGRTFDAPDPDFTISGLGGSKSSIDSTDFTATFKAGDFSKRGSPDDIAAMTAKRPAIRCVPRTGRTHHISKGADIGRAFKMLEMQCASNRVRFDFQKQRYHERPGMKRKRLISERWQRKFKNGFKATCKRVSELRRQGW